MNHLWTKGLADDEVEDFEKRLRKAKIILDKVSDICYNKIHNIKRPSMKDYESPSWSHKQAHENGQIEAYQFIIDLLTLDQREKD